MTQAATVKPVFPSRPRFRPPGLIEVQDPTKLGLSSTFTSTRHSSPTLISFFHFAFSPPLFRPFNLTHRLHRDSKRSKLSRLLSGDIVTPLNITFAPCAPSFTFSIIDKPKI